MKIKQTVTDRPTQLLAACLLASLAGGVQADTSTAPSFSEPVRLQAQPLHAATEAAMKKGKAPMLGAEAATAAAGREIRYILPIKYTDGVINNPATGKLDKVRLRSYGDRFTAPTIMMRPGQTVRMSLSNKLPAEPQCGDGQGTNVPHCFNTTNLHSHGLWVSPTGNSDNVLVSINPGVDFEYEYNVPDDHPAGTFWYHPHKHGSTAMQVGSGMAGVLVVQGDRYPTPSVNGDLDTLLRPIDPKDGNYAQVMLFQQIPYACFDAQNNIETDPVTGRWICKDGQLGEVKDFSKQFSSSAWKNSGRYTSINGAVRPEIAMESGRIYRWRMVHGGVRESIALRIRKIGDTKLLNARAATAEEMSAEVAKACNGLDVSQFEVATDGLTRKQVFEKVTNQLQPGYRSDILFTLPEAGSYCVYDDKAAATESVSAEPENAKVLAIIVARNTGHVSNQKEYITQALIQAANDMPSDVRAQVQNDLKANLRLTRFVPHPDVTDAELAASKQKVVPIVFNIGGTPTQFQINDHAYQPDRIDQTLVLGTAQAWKLSSLVASHPFHIHVNPFEIVSVRKKGPDGEPIGPEITDGQYAGMLGTWKDTIFVQPDVVVQTRTRYERYIGEFVLHCHILDHEDQGMMQNVNIVLPDGKGGAMPMGHH